MRIKTAAHLIIPFLMASLLFAQDETAKHGWQKEMAAGVTINQNSYDNWTKGGENSYSWQVNYHFKFENDREKTNWRNSGKFNYGMTKIGAEESKKSLDEIKIESVITYKLGINIDPYFSVNAETQSGAGYNYNVKPKVKITSFMDPGYIREAAGFGYKPNQSLFTRLGASIKHTLVDNTEIVKAETEYGVESVTDAKWKISDTSQLETKLQLFSNLAGFKTIDVNWDTMLSAKVSPYISMNFSIKLLYDNDISKKRQLNQVLGIGLSYNFF